MSLDENVELIDATQFLQKTRIHCIKYNYSWDEQVSNFQCFEAYLILDPEDTDNLVIVSRKPTENANE